MKVGGNYSACYWNPQWSVFNVYSSHVCTCVWL